MLFLITSSVFTQIPLMGLPEVFCTYNIINKSSQLTYHPAIMSIPNKTKNVTQPPERGEFLYSYFKTRYD